MLVALFIPLSIVLSFTIAAWAGNNKKIGFWWAFFFGLTLTPIIALLMALLSGSNKKSGLSSVSKLLTAIIAIIAAPSALYLFVSGVDCVESWGCLYLLSSIGLTGIYLYFLKQLLFVRPIPPPGHS